MTVRQPIFDGFGTVAGTSLAENLVLSGRAQLTDTEQTVLLNAVTAYMNVVRDTSVLELNRNNEKVLQRQLEATQARFDVGELTRTDVAQSEASLQGAIAARIQAEGQLTASKAIYRQVIGEDPVDVKMPDRGHRHCRPAARNPSPCRSGARSYARPSSRSVPPRTISTFSSVTCCRRSSIEGSWQRRAGRRARATARTDVGSVIGQVTIPLYQAGAPDSRVRQSKQRLHAIAPPDRSRPCARRSGRR